MNNPKQAEEWGKVILFYLLWHLNCFERVVRDFLSWASGCGFIETRDFSLIRPRIWHRGCGKVAAMQNIDIQSEKDREGRTIPLRHDRRRSLSMDPTPESRGILTLDRMVPLEVRETENYFVIEAEMPGFRAEEVSISSNSRFRSSAIF